MTAQPANPDGRHLASARNLFISLTSGYEASELTAALYMTTKSTSCGKSLEDECMSSYVKGCLPTTLAEEAIRDSLLPRVGEILYLTLSQSIGNSRKWFEV
jgi:hypothetical protein